MIRSLCWEIRLYTISLQIGLAYVEITQLLTQGESILIASVFTHYDDLVTEFKKYSTCFEDMVAIGGFEFNVKNDK